MNGRQIDAVHNAFAEKDAEIERLNVALRIAGENIVALSEKGEKFAKALMSAMALVDELLRENVRLCAASNDPPDVKLFAAKNSFDSAMKRLLNDGNGE